MTFWKVIYYQNKKGERIVREEIKSFGLVNHARIITLIGMLEEYGLNLSGRHVKHIEGKLWELRIDRYRIIYIAMINQQFLLLRAFIKKTVKTPAKEIKIALNRLNDFNTRAEGINEN